MSQGLLVFILSILVFIAGAVFINFTVKRDEAKEAQQAKEAQATEAKKAA